MPLEMVTNTSDVAAELARLSAQDRREDSSSEEEEEEEGGVVPR